MPDIRLYSASRGNATSIGFEFQVCLIISEHIKGLILMCGRLANISKSGFKSIVQILRESPMFQDDSFSRTGKYEESKRNCICTGTHACMSSLIPEKCRNWRIGCELMKTRRHLHIVIFRNVRYPARHNTNNSDKFSGSLCDWPCRHANISLMASDFQDVPSLTLEFYVHQCERECWISLLE